MDTLLKLKALDLSKADPDIIRRLMGDAKLSAIEFEISVDTLIVRGRKGGFFTDQKDMTYCPVQYCKDIQRATLAGNTMFYGVISDNQAHLENARAICAIECSELCNKGMNSVGKEIITISHWRVVKPLKVCSFITDTTFPNVLNNALLNQMRASFIRTHRLYKTSEDTINVARFISDEFAKPVNRSYEYLITATISNDFINCLGFDGVVYPSAKLGGQAGLNIALSPIAVDTKLSFIRTIQQTLYKNKEHSFIRIEAVNEDGITQKLNHASDNDVAKIIGIADINHLPNY